MNSKMQNQPPNNPQKPPYVDPWGETQPVPAYPTNPTNPSPYPPPSGTVPVPTIPPPPPQGYQTIEQARLNPKVRPAPRKRWACCSCGTLLLPVFVLLLVIVLASFLVPLRTIGVGLAIEARRDEGVLGRSDTMIVGTVMPLKPYIGM